MNKQNICGHCVNEDSGRCVVKNVKVKLNKKRRCVSFSLDETKISNNVNDIPVTRISYREMEENRKRAKENLKVLKQSIKEGDVSKYADNKHPLTGDLSRFKTTASDDNYKGENK